jgi:hypothetical protein
MITRRRFLSLLLAGAAGGLAGAIPAPTVPAAVRVPAFMRAYISPDRVAYLNAIIPALYDTFRDPLFPHLHTLPTFVVINTLTEALIQHGHVRLAADILGDEALTLLEAQHLLTTTRFGSVATPHRGIDPDRFGTVVYLKQHPKRGYRTPEHLLLEELIHVQQDITLMRHIIHQDELPAPDCLHGPLKGISELGAHNIIEDISGKQDYVFVLDDGTHCESAAHAIAQLSERLGTDEATIARALLYDVAAYRRLDALAMAQYERHPWQMVTTWRHARDDNGAVIGIAPAFIRDDTES